MVTTIAYPYLPEGRSFRYVTEDDRFMQFARVVARDHALDRVMPGGAIVVLGASILGYGANGSEYHKIHGCERVRRGCKSGEGYELCEGCAPRNHTEVKAIANVRERGLDPTGADIYFWGHWWCCRDCWQAMIAADIKDVYLLDGSDRLFNKEHPGNIVGRQFL